MIVNEIQNWIKIVVVGAPAVGKSSLISKIVYNQFNTQYKATLGVDFSFKNLTLIDHNQKEKTIKLQLWDIAGQEKQSVVNRSFYNDAGACIIVADLTCGIDKIKSDIHAWKKEIQGKIKINGEPVPIFIMLNKYDLPLGQDTYGQKEIEDFLQNTGCRFSCTSAKTGQNVLQSLEELVLLAIRQPNINKKKNNIDENLLLSTEKGCC